MEQNMLVCDIKGKKRAEKQGKRGGVCLKNKRKETRKKKWLRNFCPAAYALYQVNVSL